MRSERYLLATSVALTPANKSGLAAEIGPALITSGDIFGLEDLNGLLRKFPDTEAAHRSSGSKAVQSSRH
jgi:hypothetical protein